MAFCAFNFGYDVGTFGGVQAMQSFASEFGQYNSKTKLYALPGWLSSVMTATPFLGKAAVSISALYHVSNTFWNPPLAFCVLSMFLFHYCFPIYHDCSCWI